MSECWCRPLQKMGKNGHSSPKISLRAKLPITDPPKVWVSGFPSVDGSAKLVLAIMENGENGHSSPKMHPRAKLPITNPPKVWVSPLKCPRAKVFILPHESPMCSFTLPNIYSLVMQEMSKFYPEKIHFILHQHGDITVLCQKVQKDTFRPSLVLRLLNWWVLKRCEI